MKKVISVLVFMVLLMVSTSVTAAPPTSDYTLVYEDEFNGSELNLNDWQYRTGAKYGGADLAENVSVKDGRLFVDYKKALVGGKETYTGGGIISNKPFGYGYYETKAKVYGGTYGLHTSFWSAGGTTGDGIAAPRTNLLIEIDGFEIDSETPSDINMGYHDWTYSLSKAHPRLIYKKIDTSKEEFTMGYEWLPDRIIYYINGEKVKEDLNPEVFAPQYVWLTAVAMPEKKMDKIDDSKLPGQSYWEYFKYYSRELKGANLLGATDFEMNDVEKYGVTVRRDAEKQNVYCFIETGDKEASRVIYDNSAYEGDGYLMHTADKNYTVLTSQKLYGIANGNYTFSAYARSSGGQKTARLVAKDKNGTVIKALDLQENQDVWTLYEIKDIEIKDNYCEVGFESDASAGQWIAVDNAAFFLAEGTGGEYNKKLQPIAVSMDDFTYPGEILVKNTDRKGFESNGSWAPSATLLNTLWIENSLTGSYAKWIPSVAAEGDYVVQYYNAVYKGSTIANVEVVVGDRTHKTTLDQENGPKGWVDLGVYHFEKGRSGYVMVTPTGDRGVLRASYIRLIPKSVYDAMRGIITMVNINTAQVKNEKIRLDKYDLKITPIIENSRTLVPLRFIAQSLGAAVDFNEETSEIKISLEDTAISLTLGDSKMLVNGKEIALEIAANTYRDRTMVPLRAVSEAFSKEVFWHDSGLIIISDDKISLGSIDLDMIIHHFLGLPADNDPAEQIPIDNSTQAGELIFKCAGDNYTEKGTWTESTGVKNYDGSSTRWTASTNASFQLMLKVPKEGTYKLYFYRSVHPNTSVRQEFVVKHNGKTGTSDMVDGSQGESGWQLIGEYDFKGTGEEFVMSKCLGGENYRSTAFKLVPVL